MQDAFETLKESEAEREKEIEDLTSLLANNKVSTLNECTSAEDVQEKRHKLRCSLLKHVLEDEPKDYPIPNTSDLHVEVVTELENEIRNMREFYDAVKKNDADIDEDISYLRKKKMGLEQMKKAYLGATKTDANSTYANEVTVTNKLFKAVKADLHDVVDTVFSSNDEFKEFLAKLTTAYLKGGDDVYVDVTLDVLPYVNFLIHAAIIMYHRNTKNKVRLTDLL